MQPLSKSLEDVVVAAWSACRVVAAAEALDLE